MGDQIHYEDPHITHREYVPRWKHPAAAAALGLRPAITQHTRIEGDELRRFAKGRRALVEIGVAEGASALQLRKVMHPEGTLTLIDPMFPGRLGINLSRRIAHRTVDRIHRGTVRWIEELSSDAVTDWTGPIDFLFLDGDHSYEGAGRDWRQWTPFVADDGVVALHDAGDAPWITDDSGPRRVLHDILKDGTWRVVGQAHSVVVLSR